MMNLHQLPCVPDAAAMHHMVQSLFANAGLRGLVEIGWTSTRHPHGLNGGKLFDLGALDEAVDYAARINAAPNRNVYIAPGLRRDETAIDRRAGDADVFAVVALWADFDDPGAIQAALDAAERLNLRPTYAVFTGREPHLRGQLWWALDEACDDLSLVRQLEEALAARLGGDPAVVNVSRVMRLSGSVAWPLKEGRVLEVTGALDAPLRAAPYTIDEIRFALERAGAFAKPAETATILDFNSAEPSFDLDGLIAAAAQPAQWHKHALLAVGHLLGRGTPPDVVLDVLTGPLTQGGFSYAQTRAELRVMTQGGVARGMYRARAPEAAPAESADRDPFPLLSLAEIGTSEPPSWRIHGIVPKRGFGVLYGASGSYKSFIALDMALSVSHGLSWRGLDVEQASAVYIAGEGTFGLSNRILAWREHRAGDAQCCGFWLAPVAANLLDRGMVALISERLHALPKKPSVIFVDTLARSFGPGNENDARDMNMFVAACDHLAGSLDAFVLAIHHAGKDTDRGARGSSVLRAAADVEIAVKREGVDRVGVAVTKQKDAEHGEPFGLRMVRVESTSPLTGEVIQSLVPVADDAPIASRSSEFLSRAQRAALRLLDDGSGSLSTLAARSGTDKSNLRRVLNALVGLGYVRLAQDGVYHAVVNSKGELNHDDGVDFDHD